MAPKSETAAPAVFTAKHGVLFHGTGIQFARDRDREAPGSAPVFSFTAPGAAAAQQVRDAAAAEPQWEITEVTS